jgi:hypothetical protein
MGGAAGGSGKRRQLPRLLRAVGPPRTARGSGGSTNSAWPAPARGSLATTAHWRAPSRRGAGTCSGAPQYWPAAGTQRGRGSRCGARIGGSTAASGVCSVRWYHLGFGPCAHSRLRRLPASRCCAQSGRAWAAPGPDFDSAAAWRPRAPCSLQLPTGGRGSPPNHRASGRCPDPARRPKAVTLHAGPNGARAMGQAQRGGSAREARLIVPALLPRPCACRWPRPRCPHGNGTLPTGSFRGAQVATGSPAASWPGQPARPAGCVPPPEVNGGGRQQYREAQPAKC